MPQLPRLVRSAFTAALCSVSVYGMAQSPAPRLAGPLTSASRVPLAGSRPPRAQAANDVGTLPGNTAIPGITLAFNRSAAQEAALQTLLTAQQTPGSPQFHQWLTPEQFAAQFGVADADLSTTETWLQAQGFTIDRVARSRNRITFSGTAAMVDAAFGAELHRYVVNGVSHFAPSADLSLPKALAPLVASVKNLSDFRPAPQARFRKAIPALTSSLSGNHFLDPLDLATQYDMKSLYTSGYTGKGQSIAIVGQSYININDFDNFTAAIGQGGLSPQQILVPNTGASAELQDGNEAESDIDVEYSSAIAPGATIQFVYVGDNENSSAYDAMDYAITQDLAPIVSVSYGNCELDISTADINAATQITEQANAQGQTIVVASGDNGSTTCNGDTDLTPTQQGQLAVSFPADLPNVTAAGGLQLQAGTYAANDSQYFAPALSSDNLSSVLSYIPETVWNEDALGEQLIAGGGGTSAVVPRPAWQAGVPGIPSGAFRLLPDFALQASTDSPGYVYCTSDTSAWVPDQVDSCYAGTLRDSATGDYNVAGGTSFVAPVFAGMLAVLNQYEHATGLGNVNPTLYGLAANSTTYAAAFHDITTGSNACPAGAGYCSTPGSTAYAATTGYDEASGLGSLDFAKLFAAWPAATTSTLLGTSTSIGLTSTTLGASQTTPVTLSVTDTATSASDPNPISGTVQVFLDGAPAGSVTLSAGTGQLTLTTPAAAGSHIVKALYSGDATHAASQGTTVFTIGTLLPSGTFTLAETPITVSYNSNGKGTATVTPANGYGGLVTFTLSTSSSTSLDLCYGVNPVSTDPSAAPYTTQLTISEGTACSSTAAAARTGTGAWRLVQRSGTQALAHSPAPRNPSEPWPAPVAFAGLLVGAWGLRRRRGALPAVFSLTLLAVAGFGLTGCGGNNASPVTPTAPTAPTAPQTLSVTLTGTDSITSSITSSTNFTLTVN